MRGSRTTVLVLIALAGVAGPGALASTAAASDANLKQLVHDQQKAETAIEKRIDSAGNRIGSPRTIESYARRIAKYLRTTERLLAQGRHGYDRYRAKFVSEPSETADAEAGRVLIVQGLRDESRATRTLERRIHALTPRARRVRSVAASKRLVKALNRASDVPLGDRGDKRVKSGRKKIRNAPAPTVPTPTPPPAPTPAPTPTPTTPPLVPGLPL